MKICALAQLSGPEISARPGDVLHVEELMGRNLIAAGAAVEVKDAPTPPAASHDPEPETAALASPPEQATLRAAKPRRVEIPPEAP